MKLMEYRKKFKMTIPELADCINVPVRTVENWSSEVTKAPAYVDEALTQMLIRKKTYYRTQKYIEICKKFAEDTADKKLEINKYHYVVSKGDWTAISRDEDSSLYLDVSWSHGATPDEIEIYAEKIFLLGMEQDIEYCINHNCDAEEYKLRLQKYISI